ncbi:MAG: restriction endonuclease subunit S [Candidatus Electrothrix sp. ATG2]|nr:restriction endonuclease subunit S [Candidatus Electrothrix sp. ATG2]
MRKTTLEKIAPNITSGSRGWASFYSEEGALFLRMTNLPKTGIGLLLHDNKYVKLPKGSSEGRRTRVQVNDILISITAELGKIGFVSEELGEAYVNQHVALIRIEDPKTHPKYLAQYLASQPERTRLNRLNDSGAKAGLSLRTINRFPVILPPLPEQKAIADLLSTWDEAIKKTEKLIQAKEKQFNIILNNLIYLPTLEGKWKQVRTKSLFKERKETKRGDLPLLSITNSEGVIPRENTNRKDTSNKDKSKYLRICPGDIGYNTMRMWQGVSALSSLEGIVSPAYTICTPGEKLCSLFVAYLFKMPFMINRFYRYSQGLTSDTWNLKYHHFSEVKMPLPAIEEQEQIADTLSTAQQEIDLLKQLAEKYKTQKRGLMQKMLTGEWRVKPEIVDQYVEKDHE